MSSTMNIQGLHHITLVCSNAQRTVDFYTQVLGQHLQLPPWLEENRDSIEQILRPLTTPQWHTLEVKS